MKKRIISLLLAAVIVFGLMPCTISVSAEEVVGVQTENEMIARFEKLKQDYRHGEYWNWYNVENRTVELDDKLSANNKWVSSSGNIPVYGSPAGTGTASCPDEYNYCAYYGSCPCSCGSFRYRQQCAGYATKMFWLTWGAEIDENNVRTNINEVRAGDVVTYKTGTDYKGNEILHWIFVTKVDEDTIYYTDCNNTGPCKVSWKQTKDKSHSDFDAYLRKIYFCSANDNWDGISDCNHSYNDVGICTSTCKGEYPWQSSLKTECAGTYTVSKSDGIYLRNKPYAAAPKVSDLIKAGTDVNVLGIVTNHYSNEWYKVSYKGIEGYTHISHLTHTCSFFTEYEAVHPHKQYKKCSICSKTEYTGNTRTVDGCADCKTGTHTCNYSIVEYESVHPHKQYKKCSSCGKTEYTGKTRTVDGCAECSSNSLPGTPILKITEGNSIYLENSTISFYWSETENTTHNNLYFDQWLNGKYERIYTKAYAEQGFEKSFEAGSYRVMVQSTNSNASGWPYADSSWYYFSVNKADTIKPYKIMNYNGHTYEFYNVMSDGATAQSFCVSKGGHLVTVTNAAESSQVQTLAKEANYPYFLIGLNDTAKEGTFKWVTGEALSYTNWNSGEPNNDGSGEDYVLMFSADGTWNDTYRLCTFVCEYETEICYHTSLKSVVSKSPTCKATGYKAHWVCNGCGKYFTDSDAVNEVAWSKLTLSKADHSYSNDICIWCGLDDPNAAITGKCGDNLTWKLNETTGKLTISGSGEMYDYGSMDTPWYEYRNSITEVEVSSGMTYIGDYAFTRCSNLTDITIPKSITSIGDYAFYLCTGLSEIELPAELLSLGGSAFNGCSSLIEIEIPSGVTLIRYRTFYNCSSLETVGIPDSVTSIGQSAFAGCKKIRWIHIPPSVEIIDSDAFMNCSALASIIIPDGVEVISSMTFYGCEALARAEIPVSITAIQASAFSMCTSLSEVYYDGSKGQWGKITIANGNGPLSTATVHYAIETITGTCGNNLIWELDNGTGMLTISGTGALEDFNNSDQQPWKDLRDDIRFVVIEEGVTSLNWVLLYGLNHVTTVTVPSTVSEIGQETLSGIGSLKSIIVAEDNPNYTSIDGVLYNKEGTTLISCPGGKINGSFTVLEGVTKIETSAFANCSGLTELVLPKTLVTVGDSFAGFAENLRSITVNPENKSFCSIDGVLFDKEIDTLCLYPCGKTEPKYTVPDTVTSIGSNAFASASYLEEVVFPQELNAL